MTNGTCRGPVFSQSTVNGQRRPRRRLRWPFLFSPMVGKRFSTERPPADTPAANRSDAFLGRVCLFAVALSGCLAAHLPNVVLLLSSYSACWLHTSLPSRSMTTISWRMPDFCQFSESVVSFSISCRCISSGIIAWSRCRWQGRPADTARLRGLTVMRAVFPFLNRVTGYKCILLVNCRQGMEPQVASNDFDIRYLFRQTPNAFRLC